MVSPECITQTSRRSLELTVYSSHCWIKYFLEIFKCQFSTRVGSRTSHNFTLTLVRIMISPSVGEIVEDLMRDCSFPSTFLARRSFFAFEDEERFCLSK